LSVVRGGEYGFPSSSVSTLESTASALTGVTSSIRVMHRRQIFVVADTILRQFGQGISLGTYSSRIPTERESVVFSRPGIGTSTKARTVTKQVTAEPASPPTSPPITPAPIAAMTPSGTGTSRRPAAIPQMNDAAAISMICNTSMCFRWSTNVSDNRVAGVDCPLSKRPAAATSVHRIVTRSGFDRLVGIDRVRVPA